MALTSKKTKSQASFTPMMIGEEEAGSAVRNGRGPSEQWAATVAVRGRGTEGPLHRRLVLAFALSVLALIVVSIVAVLLSVRFEECGISGQSLSDRSSSKLGNSSLQEAAPFNQQQEAPEGDPHPGKGTTEEADGEQPWAQPRLPTHMRPLHYNLLITAFMDNFTFCGEVNIQVECLEASRYIVLHSDRVAIERVQVAEDKVSGAVRVSRYFTYPANQVFVVVLERALEAQRSYNLKIVYSALIENELLGFFRSFYLIHGERR